MSIIPQLIVNGLIAGGIYALVALGYTMVYGILKFINFAHGEIVMVGAYLGWLFHIMFGLNIIISFLLSMVFCGILGFIIERLAYRPLRKSNRLVPLITAIAVSLLLQGLAMLLFKNKIRSYRVGEISYGINVFGVVITKVQIVIIFVSLLLMLILHFFVKYTKYGKAMRATTDNIEVASVIGIDVNKTISIVFVIGSALAGAAGILLGLEQNVFPSMGVTLGIKAFTAAVVGGIGNIYGALAGGYLIGLAENIGIAFLPSGYKDAIAFFILIFMLLFKPTGIFGNKKDEEVRG